MVPCHALGCTDAADPRYAIHGPTGAAVPACESHGNPGCDGKPCTCAPHNGVDGPVPGWQAAQERRRKV